MRFCFIFFISIKSAIIGSIYKSYSKRKYFNNGVNEKAAKYYLDNKDILKEKAKNMYSNLSEKENQVKRLYSKDSTTN